LFLPSGNEIRIEFHLTYMLYTELYF